MKYRKKPVVVEAVQWDGQLDTKPDWLREAANDVWPQICTEKYLRFATWSGAATARAGDFIVRDADGAVDLLDGTTFAELYEPLPMQERARMPLQSEIDTGKCRVTSSFDPYKEW